MELLTFSGGLGSRLMPKQLVIPLSKPFNSVNFN